MVALHHVGDVAADLVSEVLADPLRERVELTDHAHHLPSVHQLGPRVDRERPDGRVRGWLRGIGTFVQEVDQAEVAADAGIHGLRQERARHANVHDLARFAVRGRQIAGRALPGRQRSRIVDHQLARVDQARLVREDPRPFVIAGQRIERPVRLVGRRQAERRRVLDSAQRGIAPEPVRVPGAVAVQRQAQEVDRLPADDLLERARGEDPPDAQADPTAVSGDPYPVDAGSAEQERRLAPHAEHAVSNAVEQGDAAVDQPDDLDGDVHRVVPGRLDVGLEHSTGRGQIGRDGVALAVAPEHVSLPEVDDFRGDAIDAEWHQREADRGGGHQAQVDSRRNVGIVHGRDADGGEDLGRRNEAAHGSSPNPGTFASAIEPASVPPVRLSTSSRTNDDGPAGSNGVEAR